MLPIGSDPIQEEVRLAFQALDADVQLVSMARAAMSAPSPSFATPARASRGSGSVATIAIENGNDIRDRIRWSGCQTSR